MPCCANYPTTHPIGIVRPRPSGARKDSISPGTGELESNYGEEKGGGVGLLVSEAIHLDDKTPAEARPPRRRLAAEKEIKWCEREKVGNEGNWRGVETRKRFHYVNEIRSSRGWFGEDPRSKESGKVTSLLGDLSSSVTTSRRGDEPNKPFSCEKSAWTSAYELTLRADGITVLR
jgi:hypothetical protein